MVQGGACYNANANAADFHKASLNFHYPQFACMPGRVWKTQQTEWHQDVSALPQAIFVRAQLAKVQCFSLLAQARLRIRHALAHNLAPGVVGLGFSGGCVFCEMPNGVEQVTGLKACFAIPLTRQGHVVSVVVFYSRWGALARLRHDRAVWMPGGVAAGM